MSQETTKKGLVPYESSVLPALRPEEVRARVNLIQAVMRGVMKKGTHYGPIPGAGDKPVLFKPGAETLAVTFQLATEPIVEDLSTSDLVHYRVKVRFTSQVTGAFLGIGVGECSSDEEKYRWRRAVNDQEFDETPEDRRRVKWQRGKNNTTYQIKQVRANPADVANTILKMAKKRAQVDGTLSVTGASDCFTQDLEDLPEELRTQLRDDDVIDVVEVITDDRLAEIIALAATRDNGKGLPMKQREMEFNLMKAFPAHRGGLAGMTPEMAERLETGLQKMKVLAEAAPAAPAPAEEKPRSAEPDELDALWVAAVQAGQPEESLRHWIGATYGTENCDELTPEQRREVILVLEGSVPKPTDDDEPPF